MTAQEKLYLPLTEPELIKKINQLSLMDLNWLNGYCAGLIQKQIPIAPSKNQEEDQQYQKIVVLYASQSGNSQQIAESLNYKLSVKGISSSIIGCDQIKTNQLKEFNIIIMVAATHGEGEPPDNSLDFYEYIHSNKAPKLNHTKYAVLSLGDSSYEFFCKTGRDFDKAFSKCGSQLLLENVDCDLDYEKQAEQWIEDLVAKISSMAIEQFITPKVSTISIANQAYNKNKPFLGSVLTQQKITGLGSVKDTYHIEISLENSAIEYKPGDCLGIWSLNDKLLVNEIIETADLNGDYILTINQQKYSLQQALIENLEITQINKKLLTGYYEIAQSENLKLILEGNTQNYIENNQLIDLLIDFPCEISEQQLADLLRLIKPRVYSISSSQRAVGDEVHLTVNAMVSQNKNSKRWGLSSNYLVHQLKEGDKVAIYLVENSNFKLPASKTDVIMIGPGTGIAPFRAFLQERDAEKASGKNWLFFGNPSFNTDFLYQLELNKYLQSGLLNQLDVAFSRDQKEKIYVQNRLLENAQKIWLWLENGSSCIYVCGDSRRMAKDVEEAFSRIIIQQGNKTPEQALQYLRALKRSKRYLRDVY